MEKKCDSFIGRIVRILGSFGLLSQCVSLSTSAAILVRTPEAEEARLQVLLQKDKTGKQSFVEYWRGKNPAKEKVEELQRSFEEAQRALLDGGPDNSISHFKKVAELALTADWKNPER